MDLEYRYRGLAHPVTLDDGEHLVGRDRNADLHLTAAEVSARHAVLRVEGERLFLRDLDSTNGTQIDGVYVPADRGEVEVPKGSIIRIAEIPLMRAEDVDLHRSLSKSDGPVMRSVYRQGDDYSRSAGARLQTILSSLFELIAASDDIAAVQQKACAFIGQWSKADRVVLMDRDAEERIRPAAAWPHEVDIEDIQLSRTIVDQVLTERTSVLLVDTRSTSAPLSESIVSLDLHTLMAAPLFDNERVRGLLYVDSQHPGLHFGDDELQMLTAAANAVAIKLRNLSLQNELDTAARIQDAMLPNRLPRIDGYELDARLEMCKEVGGDLYQVVERDDGHYILALGDVAGKGAPAALAMSACMVLIPTLADLIEDIDRLICGIQRRLYESLPPDQFITLFLADLDPVAGVLTYVNAGHEPPLIASSDGVLRRLESCAPPVGLFPEFRCEVRRDRIAPGELLAVFSDGVPEATRDNDRFMGLDGVERILSGHRRCSLAGVGTDIVRQIEAFLEGDHASDDVTLLLMRRDAGAEQAAD